MISHLRLCRRQRQRRRPSVLHECIYNKFDEYCFWPSFLIVHFLHDYTFSMATFHISGKILIQFHYNQSCHHLIESFVDSRAFWSPTEIFTIKQHFAEFYHLLIHLAKAIGGDIIFRRKQDGFLTLTNEVLLNCFIQHLKFKRLLVCPSLIRHKHNFVFFFFFFY